MGNMNNFVFSDDDEDVRLDTLRNTVQPYRRRAAIYKRTLALMKERRDARELARRRIHDLRKAVRVREQQRRRIREADILRDAALASLERYMVETDEETETEPLISNELASAIEDISYDSDGNDMGPNTLGLELFFFNVSRYSTYLFNSTTKPVLAF